MAGYIYPNGVESTYSYNTLNRLTDLNISKTATLASYNYSLGPTGNRLSVAEHGGRQVGYTYDDLYRLTDESIAGSTAPAANGLINYTYDAVGNRLTRSSTVAAVPTTSYSYDDNDRLTTDTYDVNGNTTTSGSNTYTYDFENRLVKMDNGAVTIVYDGDGNRVAKTAVGVTTRYLIDDRNLTGYAQVFEEIVSGTVDRRYTYGLDLISQTQASGISFYGYDGHGSVRFLTDTTGILTERYDYDGFGNTISSGGTTSNTYLFAGEQSDSDLRMYYNRAPTSLFAA